MADGGCNPKRVRLFGYFGHNLPLDGLVYQKPPGILTFLGTPAIESPGVAEKDLEPGQRVGGSVWKDESNEELCHLQPYRYLKILVHARCHQ